MNILFMDDFEVYDIVRTSGEMDITWLEKQYVIHQTSAANLRVTNSVATEPYQRVVLANTAATSTRRNIYLPLGDYLRDHTTVTISHKLVDLVPNGAHIGGISSVSSDNSNNHIITFGFTSSNEGFVTYVNEDNVVTRDEFRLSTSLSGRYDTVEYTIVKDTQNSNEYRSFVLWVNNRPAYVGNVFCQVGSAGTLAARVLGAASVLNVGTVSPSKYFGTTGNVTVPRYGTTDIIVTDGTRPGRVRVISRRPDGDIGPNTMLPSRTAESHAELVKGTPPNTSDYLTAISASMEERFWSQAYDDLSSENVLAVAVRLLCQKNSPDAMDMVPVVYSASGRHAVDPVPTDLVPMFSTTILQRNPWTNLNWTPLEANSLQFGATIG